MDKPYGEEKLQSSTPDFEELSRNMARFIEGAGKAAAAYLKPVQEGQPPSLERCLRGGQDPRPGGRSSG